jgi:hypothetical protein
MRAEDYFMLFTFLLLVTVFLSWYVYLKTRNKERMALIERDKDLSELYARRKTDSGFKFPWLKVGIITTGFSIGWLVAILVQELIYKQSNGSHSVNSGAVIMGIIFLFTSVSILVSYFVDKPKNKE